MRLVKEDFILGAIYRIGARRQFDRETLVRLLTERARLSLKAAQQLVAHWLTTEPFRRQS